MDATDVLRDRMQHADGLQPMLAVSLLAHGVLVALVALAPGSWFTQRAREPRTMMTISLSGGVPGPQNGGLTTIGGRPVQAETPPETPKRPEAVRAPAARTPEMTVPKRGAPPVRNSTTPVKEAPDQARGRTPTRGAETVPGSAVAETGVRGQGFGLSTGGGPGSGSTLDVADFCCPDYLVFMVQRIRNNWDTKVDDAGKAVVKFTIQRDGRIVGPSVEKSSGYSTLDLNALRALVYTKQLPALPDAFPNPTLTVNLIFEYTR
jgi:periplasmic protein TonB